MRRFFVEEISERATLARITGEEFLHLKKALRLTVGDEVALFNGRGLELRGVIESIGRDYADIKITGTPERSKESPLEVILLQGLLKGDKPELIIQKATELGVKEVSFFPTSRTVPVTSAGSAKEKRWQRAAIEAAKQCGRACLPRINFLKDLNTALSAHEGLFKLILWERESEKGLKEALKAPKAKKGVVVLVGPEGGFSEEDVMAAKNAGFAPVGLGPRILRAETAAIAILAIIQYEFGDAG